MAASKDRLKQELVVALKAHDEARKSTVRMALAAIANEEVAGKVARELSDAEVMANRDNAAVYERLVELHREAT